MKPSVLEDRRQIVREEDERDSLVSRQSGGFQDQRAGRDEYADDDLDEIEEPGLALREIQIPVYTLLLESLGERVEGALYWSIEKAKAVGYIRPAGSAALRKPISSAYKDADDTGPARSALKCMLADAAAALARGEFLDRAADRASCADCAFAPLCRYWYFLELR